MTSLQRRMILGVFLFFGVTQAFSQTIDFTADCDSQMNIPVTGTDATGHHIFELGDIRIQYDGLYGRWVIYHNGTFIFFQNSLSSPNPPSNLSWTSFGNDGCNTVSQFDVNVSMEDCTNGIDDDGDGSVDCLDSDCSSDASCIDTDGDGIYDIVDIDIDNDGIPNVIESFSQTSSTQLNCTNSTNMNFSTIPTLLSGVDMTEGAIYKYSNVAAGLDAIVTIMRVSDSHVTISAIDDNSTNDWMFKPE